MPNANDRLPSDRVVLVMNPRSGGGKVARFRLVERAKAAGARVRLTGPNDDAAALARAPFRQLPRWPSRRSCRWW
jgi:hypothetical protein